MMRWKKPRIVNGINESARPVAKKGTPPLTFQPGWSPLKSAITLCAGKRAEPTPPHGPADDIRIMALCNQLHPELHRCVQRCLKPICAIAEAEARLKLHHYGRHVAHFGAGVKALEEPELFEDTDAADFVNSALKA